MLLNTGNICHLRVQEAIAGTNGPAEHFWLPQRVFFFFFHRYFQTELLYISLYYSAMNAEDAF